MKRMLVALLSTALLVGCAPAKATDPAATPTPEPAAAPTAAPAVTPEPSPAETPDPLMDLAVWSAAMPGQAPNYAMQQAEAQLNPDVTWPEEGVTLRLASWGGSLEEAAETYGVPLETLQALNPSPEIWQDMRGNTYYSNLILEQNYKVPTNPVKQVTVGIPWIDSWYEESGTYTVPAALSDQAAACMATAYYFQYHHFGMHLGIEPSELLPGDDYYYYSTEGALYTSYSDLEQFLHCVYTPDRCEDLLGGPLAEKAEDAVQPYYQGENDTICFQMGDRGSNITYCGMVYTEPELQPDGSIEFWQLSLTVESDAFVGWGQGITYTPDTASASIVRLEPSENGWRVAELSLPN